ncbi:uncharacterized protein [Antedon mediterranea]|uniref:uncharacterized protein n=1 Tax=Antedon mediterranea TaxID=105859 RepID=UPI003AF7F38C
MWFKLFIFAVSFQISLAQFGVSGSAKVTEAPAKPDKPSGGFGIVSHDEIELTTKAPPPKRPSGGFGVMSHDEVTEAAPTKKPSGAAGSGTFNVGGQAFVTEASAKRPDKVTKQSKPSINNVLCKYGIHSKRDCCYGWKRVGGQCIPICEQECVHGKCVGPNKCQCDKGFTGPICNQDYNECGDMPWRCTQRCMNTLGSYKCYCDHGYVLQQDQYTCSRDNRCDAYRCVVGCEQYDNGFRCICPDGLRLAPNGLSCIDIDECKEQLDNCAADRVCRNTFGNFFCSCPEGLSFNYDVIDGKKQLVCRDRNECDYPNNCNANADCINLDPGYGCRCKTGYTGDGVQCTKIDERTCDNNPCFIGVECIDIGPNPEDPLAKLFVCRTCPVGYVGDGITCIKVEKKLIVVVEDEKQPGVPVEAATVNIFTMSDNASIVTEEFDKRPTNDEGFAELNVPTGEAFIVAVSKKGYLDTSKTYSVVPGKNVIQFELDRTSVSLTKDFTYNKDESERMEFYFNPSSTGRGDEGFVGQDGGYAVTFPAGSLSDDLDGQVIEVALRHIDISDPLILARAPELVGASIVSGRGYERQPLESFGMAEITVIAKSGRQEVALLGQVTLEFPLNSVENAPDVGEKIGAYFYDKQKGLWIEDGEGLVTTNVHGDTVWVYNATHFTWWNADRVFSDSNCVTVRACNDPDCISPAGNTMITLSGTDFAYTQSKQTDENGQTCFNFKQGGNIVLTAPCSGSQEFVVGTGEYSRCSATLAGRSIFSENNIREVLDSSACQDIKFVLQGFSQDCSDPGLIGDGVRIGTDFSYGSNVTFFCNSNYNAGSGSPVRVCHSCGDWSGSQPHCFPTDYESSGQSEFGEFFP